MNLQISNFKHCFFFAALSLLCACTVADNTESLQVYAAASLTTAVSKIAAAFEAEHPGTKVRLNFAASSLLARQLEHGARADIYISANTDWMNYLQQKDLLQQASQQLLLTNRLVLVVPAASSAELKTVMDLIDPKIRRIAVADWTHVPAGVYARQALKTAGLWQQVRGKCIPTLNARATLVYVERGDVDCGLVYASDAAISRRVRIALFLPDSIQPAIRYPVAIMKGSHHPLTNDFFTFLQSSTARPIFTINGFSILTTEEKSEQR